MMDKVTFEYWKELMFNFCHMNNSIGRIVKRPSMGSAIEYYFYRMRILYKGQEIVLEQGATTLAWKEDFGPSNLVLICEISSRENIFLYLDHRDWWSKIFSRKEGINNDIFDKTFTIKSSKGELGKIIFSNKKIVDMFINNNFLILNISTKKNISKVILRDLRQKVYTKQEMSDMLYCMQQVIDAIYLTLD